MVVAVFGSVGVRGFYWDCLFSCSVLVLVSVSDIVLVCRARLFNICFCFRVYYSGSLRFLCFSVFSVVLLWIFFWSLVLICLF